MNGLTVTVEISAVLAAKIISDYLRSQGYEVIGDVSPDVGMQTLGYGGNESDSPVFRGFKARAKAAQVK